MKKLIKNNIFGFILGIILCSGIVYAVSYYAKDISYQSSDANWEVDNVNDAINDLYNMVTELETIKSLGNATAEDIALGKTAVVNGSLIEGLMKGISINPYNPYVLLGEQVISSDSTHTITLSDDITKYDLLIFCLGSIKEASDSENTFTGNYFYSTQGSEILAVMSPEMFNTVGSMTVNYLTGGTDTYNKRTLTINYLSNVELTFKPSSASERTFRVYAI